MVHHLRALCCLNSNVSVFYSICVLLWSKETTLTFNSVRSIISVLCGVCIHSLTSLCSTVEQGDDETYTTFTFHSV